MKHIHQFLFICFLVASIALVLPKNAISEDNTCYLDSSIEKLHISIYNVIPAGTIGILIWKGQLKQNQQILLKSKFGRIYYEYSTNPEASSSMIKGLIRSCKEGETVVLP
jgi:hypothetical protein